MTTFDITDVPGELARPEWLKDVEADLGRPLRVLNLGNIANNGFQNSKIMRRAGIDADCVAYDYYHVMGTAEWEDAQFSGNIGDQFYPDWWRVRFKNYKRPEWFIQGPKTLCLDYIHTKYDETKTDKERDKAWRLLRLETFYTGFGMSALQAFPKNPLKWPSWVARKLAFFFFLLGFYIKTPSLMKIRFSKQVAAVSIVGKAIITVLGLPLVLLVLILSHISDFAVKLNARMSRERRYNYLELRRAKRSILIRDVRARIYPVAYSITGFAARMVRKITGRRFSDLFSEELADKITVFLGVRSKSKDRITVNMSVEQIQRRRELRRQRRLEAQISGEDLAAVKMQEQIEDAKIEEVQEFKQDRGEALYEAYLYYLELAHPDQAWIKNHYQHFEHLDVTDIRQDITVAKTLSDEWEGIFDYYDVVLSYSTDGILSMAGSELPFFTYEHGTLRSIPFENTTMGRLCATSYRMCEAIMVTNLDNVDKPPRLGMRPEQVVYLPHAVDDKKLLGFRYMHRNENPSDHEHPTFLCPARQDWGDDDPSLMKGNDKLLHATKIVFDEGYRPKIIMFEWGRHIQKSKDLIEQLGIGSVITWVKPMKKTELWKSYFRCHAIVDQFSIPAFGGVTFEGLTFSKRILTSIDEEASADFFGEKPPVLNCKEPEEIAAAMRVVLDDPEDKAGLGKAGGDWAKAYHSSQRILDLQLNIFEGAVRRRQELRSRQINVPAVPFKRAS